jgi:hypothetical protein
MCTPEIDNILERFSFSSDLIDRKIADQLKEIYHSMSCIKPGADDEVRKIWLEIPRGKIENFGEFKEYVNEGIVETYEEFESLWKEYYPEKTKWYSFATARYKDELFFYFNSKLIFSIKANEKYKENISNTLTEIYESLHWLELLIEKETKKLKKDPEAYNDYIAKQLSWKKRFGRIKRKDFWNILGDNETRLDVQLGKEKIEKLNELTLELKIPGKNFFIPQMTANDFFRYCEICYDANDYFKKADLALSPKEKYLRMADGRDAGLRNLEGDSEQAFYDWYHSGERLGAHPWEICRGGNSTHISLFVSDLDQKWRLVLAGSSDARVVETVIMAIALYEHNIPFILQQPEEILQMVTGNDYIGIVPDFILPRYCHSFFPEEDKIIDFMNLGHEQTEDIIQNSYWYPLEKIECDR